MNLQYQSIKDDNFHDRTIKPADRRCQAAHSPPFFTEALQQAGKGKRQRLHAFDKAAGRAYATTPDDATVRNTFYNFDNHPQRFSLEPLLGIYEHDAAPVIAGLLEHKDIRRLTEDDRYKLAVFVAVQRARTFGELERISGMISVLTDKLAAMGVTEEQAGETLGLSPGAIPETFFCGSLSSRCRILNTC